MGNRKFNKMELNREQIEQGIKAYWYRLSRAEVVD
jgi:hypothetical protein